MGEHLEQQGHNWFVRSHGKVTGPFPAGLIGRYLLLGRIGFEDEVSADRQLWTPVKRVRGLIPEVIMEVARNPNDEAAKERLKAAKRWADERLDDAPRTSAGDRGSEEQAELKHRALMAGRQHKRRRQNRLLQTLFIIVFSLAVTGVALLVPPREGVSEPDCNAPAAPGVIWRNCLLAQRELANSNLEGADLRNSVLRGAMLRAARLVDSDIAYSDLSGANLRGADLSGANLKGANLRGADLSHARLHHSDLSYADLTGANIGDAELTGAKLDHAILGVGDLCLPGSIGRCQRAERGR